MKDFFYEPHLGDSSLRLSHCDSSAELIRTNYFSLYFFEQGQIMFTQELHRYEVEGPALCGVNTYQPHSYQGDAQTRGRVIQFHANFLCIETYHEEIGCNGVVFNPQHSPAAIPVPQQALPILAHHFDSIQEELNHVRSGRHDALLSHLKLTLILASRLKIQGTENSDSGNEVFRSRTRSFSILQEITPLIESYYKEERGADFYAGKLGVTTHQLHRMLKKQANVTVAVLLCDRLIREAKWQLLHTDKPIKILADELHFRDEFYFSRWFKKHTGLAPVHFRRFEWEIRGVKSP